MRARLAGAGKKKKNRPKYIIGIDEAGRGPLAGPITVAAVLLPKTSTVQNRKFLKGIKDSKKTSPRVREEWFCLFRKSEHLTFQVSSVSSKIIDRRGITYAVGIAVARCLERFSKNFQFPISPPKADPSAVPARAKPPFPPEADQPPAGADNFQIFLDGSLYAPDKYPNQRTIIKGDETVPVISAASIVAKITRDRKMLRLAKKYPQYGFEIHKGYGTYAHERAIKKHGFCDIHRRSFCRKFL